MADPTVVARQLRDALGLLRGIPEAAAWRLGQGLGDLIAGLPLRDVRRTREHLRRAFPAADDAWIQRTTRRCWRHFGGMALVTLVGMTRPGRDQRRGIAVEGAGNLRAMLEASRRGEGTVAYTGHVGNWELLCRLVGGLMPVSVIGRRLRHPVADALVRDLRTNGGARLIYQDADIRDLIRELRAGRIIATLADQDVPSLAGVFVPWFGESAYTPSAPAGLALVARCAVQPVFFLRRAGRWVLHIGPRMRLGRTVDREAGILAITRWTTAYQEALVRAHPEQWVWWHKRWRTRPEDRPESAQIR